ncbi:hypothetical protein BC567DRAFT_36731 [Phyllosticta citribraziliensis]
MRCYGGVWGAFIHSLMRPRRQAALTAVGRPRHRAKGGELVAWPLSQWTANSSRDENCSRNNAVCTMESGTFLMEADLLLLCFWNAVQVKSEV